MVRGINMWKDILKLDPDEAREFNELGDKYAPEDMESANLNRNMNNRRGQIEKDTEKYNAIKNKIEGMKDEIDEWDYEAMMRTLKLMERHIGMEMFRTYLMSLKSIAKGYPIFFRGRVD